MNTEQERSYTYALESAHIEIAKDEETGSDKPLGAGNTNVYEATYGSAVHIALMKFGKEEAADFNRLAGLLLKCYPCPHIINVLGYTVLPAGTGYGIVMERAEFGSLRLFLGKEQGKGAIPAKKRIEILRDIGESIKFLHTLTPFPFWARNLSSKSVLLKEYFHAKLGRLRLARAANEFMGHMDAKDYTGTLVAPEILKAENTSQSPLVDSFAYGVLMYEVFRNEILDGSKESRSKLEEAALKTEFGKQQDKNLMKQGALIMKMANAKPEKRLPIAKVLPLLARIL